MGDFEEKRAHPLAPLTSWKIGGIAERFYCPPDLVSLVNYLQSDEETPVSWLGLGSNVLIRDGGIKGRVIWTRRLQHVEQQQSGLMWAEAGLACAKFARFCTQAGFGQAAFFAGIPGTIGGALTMNAGAFGGQTWEWVARVKVINQQGAVFFRLPSDYEVSYRSVRGKFPEQSKEAFIGAEFLFPELCEKGEQTIRALLQKRAQTQPIGTWNCGSVYRNPPGDFAARLIEACALKGQRIGDAMISPKHANFIINCGKARAQEVETLMALIEKRVKEQWGVILQPEVKILGQKEE